MKRLIVAEFKKIFKSKINIVLIVVLMLFSGFQTYQNIHTLPMKFSENNLPLKDIHGQSIDSSNYYTFADQYYHQYAGKLDHDLLSKMRNDANTILNDYQPKEIDVAYMTSIYGENYESKIEDVMSGRYTISEIRELFPNLVSGFSFTSTENSDKVIPNFPTYYKEDSVRYLYEVMFDVLEWGQRNIDTVTYKQFDTLHRLLSLDSTAPKEAVYTLLLTSLSDEDSIQGLSYYSLFVIIILLSNIFAIEKQYKTDQIIVPSKQGNKKIVFAKLFTGGLLSIGIILLQVIIVFLITSLFIPIRDLNLIYQPLAGVYLYNIQSFIYSYKEIIINAILLMSISSLVVATFTMGLSYIFKNRFTCVVPMLLITLFTCYVPVFQTFLSMPILDWFLPGQMFNFNQYFSIHVTHILSYYTPYITFNSHIIAYKDIVMIFWGVIIILLSGGVYLNARKHTVTSH